MVVTKMGIDMLLSALQPAKTPFLIVVMGQEMEMLVRLLQFWNA